MLALCLQQLCSWIDATGKHDAEVVLRIKLCSALQNISEVCLLRNKLFRPRKHKSHMRDFFFSTRIESRSKFKSPGTQTAPWLHWIWSDSTAGLNPKATSWVKFLWTQLEFLIKTKLMNVAHCRLLQLAHLHFSQCLITVLIIQQLGSPFHLPRLSIFRQILSTAYVRYCHLFPAFPHTGRTLVSPADPEGIEPFSSSTICPSSHA